LPSLARRLGPLIVFVVVLGLAMAGLFSHSKPQLVVGGAAHGVTGASGSVTGTAAGVSSAVGPIPGAGGQTSQWLYAADQAGPAPATLVVAAKPFRPARSDLSRLGKLREADVLVVGGSSLPAGLPAALSKLPGVRADVPVEAGRIRVDGVFVNVLGVDPVAFRPFAAGPTARSALLWQNIAAGGMAISYTMGSQARLSLTKPVTAVGARTLRLPVAGFGTVGIGGVDAVVSDAVAKSLGLPTANAIVISAPAVRLDTLMARIRKRTPPGVAVAALVTQVIAKGSPQTTGSAGVFTFTTGQGPGLTARQLIRFLTAAESRIGMPYVWGGAGPTKFDCSGLVQWSMAQAGILMPRIAADQARTGPLVPLSDLQPGDLLFYHTDPTAPDYISHVAIYLGGGRMLQAPEPGMSVEVVAADFGAGFAGAIRIYPRIAAALVGSPVG
jgi:peptidoglycan DL-endopeptidase CwlO